LATTNDYVDKINEKMMNIKTFNSSDQAMDDTNTNHLKELLNTLLPNWLPPHKLVLKVNFLPIHLRNLNLSNGLCNETRMVYKSFTNKVIHDEIRIRQDVGKTSHFTKNM
ncbi:hypothetical protein E1A91_A02G096700v1, partial [Gossypium mustelinum]